ncbi:3-beta hydroxysteroid dehydrogenase/isomerase family domain-containing protein [Ditylenchus destructor]|uniref:3-beta hydroxysteroid dehydrogenase/isomerase family domain-containing protein n=1 Tax=Ditylenchus destructor TaxID=166010 RepID=A0AAD4MV40_9BILA|nr:3-beta hydroxysteroid dehydrogenase/isomerase family domain-containing protein [Ditylenchus destructor]
MAPDESQTKVLVTGASGYVALHCVQQLLAAGYNVRGTVRSLKNESKVEPLRQLKGAQERLELVEADLVENVEKWPSVIQDCEYILHVASPWPIVADESTIQVAVDGTMNVLKAATQCQSVKKIVLTSSCAAVNDGHRNDERIFDESCWTKLENETKGKHSPKVDNYAKSKTLAESTAWQYWKSLDAENRYQLTVINPTFVTGPVLSSVEHGSATIIGKMMDVRTFPAVPKVCLGFVDVRDVAKAHILALKTSSSDGQRILVTHKRPVWFSDVVSWLAEEFRSKGYLVPPPITVPNWAVRLYAKLGLDKEAAAVLHRLGGELRFSNEKSFNILGMQEYIDPRQSVIEMIYSMIEKGMVRQPPLRKLCEAKKASRTQSATIREEKCQSEVTDSVNQKKASAA